MSELTKEWLLTTIAELEEERDAVPGVVNEDAVMALAAMKLALASLEAEPVAYIGERMLADLIDGARSCGRIWPEVTDKMSGEDRIPLFLAPPAPASVPDVMDVLGGVCCEVSYAVGWNACRAAMLQGAEPVSNRDELPDGWVMLPAEPTQAMMNAWLSEVANWRGHAAGYRAMIAAAPQQEVK
ncbi:hypothetical protein NY486_09475 [Enterobacter hormaechei]|nr:hypothetical protein [Enterobacter hormaechei]